MAVAAWILISLPLLIAAILIAAGIELNRRSYRDRNARTAHSDPKRMTRPVAEDGRPHELQTKRAA